MRVQANYCVFVVQQLQGVLNLSGLPFGGPICSPLSATSVGILTTFASNADAERWRDTFLTSLSFLVNYAQVRERSKGWWARAAARRELGVEQAEARGMAGYLLPWRGLTGIYTTGRPAEGRPSADIARRRAGAAAAQADAPASGGSQAQQHVLCITQPCVNDGALT